MGTQGLLIREPGKPAKNVDGGDPKRKVKVK